MNKRKENIDRVVNALWNGTAKLIAPNPNDNCIACMIGEYWFYFIGMEDERMTPDEVRKSYTIFEVAEMIYDTINGFCDADNRDEYEYYCIILGLNKEKCDM